MYSRNYFEIINPFGNAMNIVMYNERVVTRAILKFSKL